MISVTNPATDTGILILVSLAPELMHSTFTANPGMDAFPALPVDPRALSRVTLHGASVA